MSTHDDPQGDPQTHLDTDPVNAGDPGPGSEPDTTDDPAHDTGEDEGWESEGGADPTGPATT